MNYIFTYCIIILFQPLFSEEKSWLYRIFCSGGIDVADPDNPIDNKEHCIMAFFKTTMANILNNSLVKALVIVVFLLYLAGAGYGVTNLKEGLERRKLSKVDSYSVEFFDREDLYYREFPYRIQVILTFESLFDFLFYSPPIIDVF